MEPDCPLCAIVRGERSANVLYEDDGVLAILDQNPAVDGHTLVFPTEHRERAITGDDGDAAIFEAIRTVTDALDRTLDPDGFSVFYTTGPLVGTVAHAHIHVIPRFEDDDISLSLTRGELDEAAGAELAERIRNNC